MGGTFNLDFKSELLESPGCRLPIATDLSKKTGVTMRTFFRNLL